MTITRTRLSGSTRRHPQRLEEELPLAPRPRSSVKSSSNWSTTSTTSASPGTTRSTARAGPREPARATSRSAGRRRTATRSSAASSSSIGCAPGNISATNAIVRSAERPAADRRHEAGPHDRRLAAAARPDDGQEASRGPRPRSSLATSRSDQRAVDRRSRCASASVNARSPLYGLRSSPSRTRRPRSGRAAARAASANARVGARPSRPRRDRASSARRSGMSCREQLRQQDGRAAGRRPPRAGGAPSADREVRRGRRCPSPSKSTLDGRRPRGRPPVGARTRAPTRSARRSRTPVPIEPLPSIGEGPQAPAAQVPRTRRRRGPALASSRRSGRCGDARAPRRPGPRARSAGRTPARSRRPRGRP